MEIEKLTENEFQIIWNRTLNKISAIGKNYEIDNSIMSLKFGGFFKHNSLEGFCRPLSSTLVEIQLNECLLKKGCEQLLINNICHEYCHYLQLKEAKRNHVYPQFTFLPNYDLYFGGFGKHSAVWESFADTVNEKLKLKFPITATATDVANGFMKQISYDDTLFALLCNKDNSHVARYLYVDPELDSLINFGMLTFIYNFSRDDYLNCFEENCPGKLELIVYDNEFKKLLEEAGQQMRADYLAGKLGKTEEELEKSVSEWTYQKAQGRYKTYDKSYEA